MVLYKCRVEYSYELDVNIWPDATSRANGMVGRKITKRLVKNNIISIISNYSETYSQNLKLLNLLKHGKLIQA